MSRPIMRRLAPAEPPASANAKLEVDSVQAGKTAAAGLRRVPWRDGITKMPGIPSLVGQEPKYLVTAMTGYKSGERKNDTMKAMVAPISDASMDDIGLFYALQKPARAQTPAAGDASAGQGLSAPCAACHGADGVSGNPSSPSLAGQDAQYLAAALHAYKDGTRGNTTMKALAAALSDTAIKNLAAFYAGLQPQPPDVRKPLSAAEWAERCDRCHGVNGNSTDPHFPALAGQREEYLEKVLDAYRTGARRSPEMAAMAEVLSENDVRNLAAYYARQKSQAVVYVPIPPRRRTRYSNNRRKEPDDEPYVADRLDRRIGRIRRHRASRRRRRGGQGQGDRLRHVPRSRWRRNPDGSQAGGRESSQVLQAMNDYKSGKRDNAMMKTAGRPAQRR